jgi:hypothetical protein
VGQPAIEPGATFKNQAFFHPFSDADATTAALSAGTSFVAACQNGTLPRVIDDTNPANVMHAGDSTTPTDGQLIPNYKQLGFRVPGLVVTNLALPEGSCTRARSALPSRAHFAGTDQATGLALERDHRCGTAPGSHRTSLAVHCPGYGRRTANCRSVTPSPSRFIR